MFAVVRHPEAGIGTAPDEAMVHMRALGWVRVSEYRPDPNVFHLPDFIDAPDLDAEPEGSSPLPGDPDPAQVLYDPRGGTVSWLPGDDQVEAIDETNPAAAADRDAAHSKENQA